MTAPILLTAGGTGGHIFPAYALAEELRSRGYEVSLATDRRGADIAGVPTGVDVHQVSAESVTGRGLLGRIRGLTTVALGVIEARRLLRRLRPAGVVGFGGYASLPAVLAATQLGQPALIHEQNAVLGRANRLLARRVEGIATSFSETMGLRPGLRAQVEHTGNPVRAAVAGLSHIPYPAPKQDGPFDLLVFGGSQGAAVFGDVVPRALALLPAPLRERLRVVQQCREAQLDLVRCAYSEASIEAELAPFFDDMPARIAAAQLVIARAGASTIAELTAAGRPAILVPYPFSADHHQKMNADAVEAAGGGWVVPQTAFTPETLEGSIETFLRLRDCLAQAARKARLMGRPDATARLTDFVVRLMRENLPANRHGVHTEIAA